MGRAERTRWNNNDRVLHLLKESDTRALQPEEVEEIRAGYTGYGGLSSNTFGQFFTPQAVTNFVIDLLGITGGRILEPSCGSGAFLEPLPSACQIEAFELMHEASSVARLLYPSASITTGNTLTHLQDLEGRFDYVIGNPPFCDVPKYDDYSGYEISQKGRGRAEWFFIELGLRALRPGGLLAYVVPDGILGNPKDLPLRKWIMEKAAIVRGVISLPSETFKLTGTTVKTSVLVLQKKFSAEVNEDYQVFMAICEEIGWDSRGRKTGKCNLPAILAAWREMYPDGLPTLEEAKDTAVAATFPADPPTSSPVPRKAAADGRWEQLALGF